MSDYSRPLRLAESLTGAKGSVLERTLAASRVIVSVDRELPGALLTAQTLTTTLSRLPGEVLLDPSDLTNGDVATLAAASSSINGQPLSMAADGDFATRIHIGLSTSQEAIRVVPDGYGAHVASDASHQIVLARPANALGSIYAAALGATELFKIAAAVSQERASLHGALSFCPVALSDDLGAAPDLPAALELELALVGLGAVGSAAALILGHLPTKGKVLLVDRERFAPENVGTYSLGGQDAAGGQPWKVDMAAVALSHLEVLQTTEPVENLPIMIDEGKLPWPSIILSGLDSIEARHAAQRLWPDLLVDAATGDTLVGIHVAEPYDPCLLCFFPPRRTGPSAAENLAAATGLSIERAGRGDDPLTDEDLIGLPDTQQGLLRPHVGKPVCGLADAFGLSQIGSRGDQPAIPFAAQQAASLGVGRVLAHLLGYEQPYNFVQYDAFRGPQRATIEHRHGLSGCYCKERRTTIDRVRELRNPQPDQ